MSLMWRYTLAVIALWVINPELRRLYDWHFGFARVEVFSLLPLVSLLPYFWSLTVGAGWRRLPPLLLGAAWIWLAGFSYALVIAVLSGNAVSGVYDFLTFVLPITVGLWIAADDAPLLSAYRRVTRVLFTLATVTSVYGIIQWVFAPGWDALWVEQLVRAGAGSFGLPKPFEIRVFGTLNSVGTLAVFLGFMLILALPELSLKKPALLFAVPFWIITFALTGVRTAWLLFAVGLLTYFVFSPRRATLLNTLALTTALVAALITVLPQALENEKALDFLSTRVSTFGSLEDDQSANYRQGLYSNSFDLISPAPFGRGLGVTGASVALNGGEIGPVGDSGVLERAYEMGIPGLLMYVIPQLLIAFGLLRTWYNARGEATHSLQSSTGAAIGVLLAFVVLQFSDDAAGVLMLTVWLIACLSIRTMPQKQARRFQAAPA